jgi:hypothetical protein
MKYEEPWDYLERTGKEWPKENAVYFTPKDGHGIWDVTTYAKAEWLNADVIIVATEAGIPPKALQGTI